VDSKARKRKILRDRKAGDHIPGSRAIVAAAYESDAWKRYLQETCELADLVVSPMSLFGDTIMDHLWTLPKPYERCSPPWNCCVAHPVYEDEIRSNPLARAALKKESDGLRAIDTWREDVVGEWGGVKNRAKKRNRKIHMGMVFQICVGGDSEKEKLGRLRTSKGVLSFVGMMRVMKVGMLLCFGSMEAPLQP
jgi:hypothetical protein